MHASELKNLECPDLYESLSSCAPEHEWLKDHKFLSGIPLLNYTPLHLLKDLQLVRFRGMIQDMQDPEIYLQRYEVRNKLDMTARVQNGKYRDILVVRPGEEVSYDSNLNIRGERRTFIIVAIPGINNWAFDYEEQSNRANIPEIGTCTEQDGASAAKKRSAPNDESMEVCVDENFAGVIKEDAGTSPKRQWKFDTPSKETKTVEGSTLGPEYLLNSPIPERPSKVTMVKVYRDFDNYSLNSIVDVVGFLSVNPALDGSNADSDMCDGNEDSVNEFHAHNPPPSLIPRLHAVSIQILPHHNPLLDERFLSKTKDIKALNMASIQKDLRVLLALCFFNDELAAEYMLSHLISTIYTRSEFQSIGKFSLNICNLPKDLPSSYTKKLYEIMQLLLPSSHYLPLTLNVLNTAAFVPKKDYKTNKLISGLLQLAPHTHLVLDETQLEQGKLDNSGVLAIQNLSNLINHQQIKCNFQFYEIDYDVDVPIFVLSEGRSMLPNDITLPLQCEKQPIELMDETLKAARHFLHPERLDRFRRYLTQAKMTTYEMDSDDSKVVQQDFVEMRKSGNINSADDLHALLVLSRLLGIARGKEKFDEESWAMAKEMESQRKSRVQSMPKSNRTQRS